LKDKDNNTVKYNNEKMEAIKMATSRRKNIKGNAARLAYAKRQRKKVMKK